MVSSCLGSKVEIWAEDDAGNSLLEVVVRISLVFRDGRRVLRRLVRSEMVVVEGRGSERVVGRLRPGNEVSRILIVVGAIMLYSRTSTKGKTSSTEYG